MKRCIAAIIIALYCFNATSCVTVNGEKSPAATAVVWGFALLTLYAAFNLTPYDSGGGGNGGYDGGGNNGGGSDSGSRSRDYFSFRLNGFEVKLKKAQ